MATRPNWNSAITTPWQRFADATRSRSAEAGSGALRWLRPPFPHPRRGHGQHRAPRCRRPVRSRGSRGPLPIPDRPGLVGPGETPGPTIGAKSELVQVTSEEAHRSPGRRAAASRRHATAGRPHRRSDRCPARRSARPGRGDPLTVGFPSAPSRVPEYVMRSETPVFDLMSGRSGARSLPSEPAITASVFGSFASGLDESVPHADRRPIATIATRTGRAESRARRFTACPCRGRRSARPASRLPEPGRCKPATS
jgi:hypothetical protein